MAYRSALRSPPPLLACRTRPRSEEPCERLEERRLQVGLAPVQFFRLPQRLSLEATSLGGTVVGQDLRGPSPPAVRLGAPPVLWAQVDPVFSLRLQLLLHLQGRPARPLRSASPYRSARLLAFPRHAPRHCGWSAPQPGLLPLGPVRCSVPPAPLQAHSWWHPVDSDPRLTPRCVNKVLRQTLTYYLITATNEGNLQFRLLPNRLEAA